MKENMTNITNPCKSATLVTMDVRSLYINKEHEKSTRAHHS